MWGQGKGVATRHDNLSRMSRANMWSKRTNSFKMFFDLHVYAGYVCTHTHMIKKLKYMETCFSSYYHVDGVVNNRVPQRGDNLDLIIFYRIPLEIESRQLLWVNK